MAGLLHDVLAEGVKAGASDVHIKEDSPIHYWIAGDLVDYNFVPDSNYLDAVINEMVPAQDHLNQFMKQGDLDLSYVEPDVGRFRVNIHRERGGKCLTMRHVKSKIALAAALHLPPVIDEIAEAERGIIILSGTTGSGKSTTMAAMLQHINEHFTRHIITIEDPIEYEFFDNKSFFEQREVGIDTISFNSALIHALRQDPDVIMVGEMRNRESFDAALQAADTGHLVMSTLHASTAPQTINRLLDFYDREEQDPIREALAINLKAIIAQRLIPKAFGGGVVPGVEIMISNSTVRKLIMENNLEKLQTVIEGSGNEGMQSFNQSLLKFVNDGLITEEDALLKSNNPDQLKMNLKGIFLGSDHGIIG
ncbi:MAG: PilT/PilU family type 4a pilus ATPase [Victivallales bacterium]|nr:PilT/PilU family type 4a pilus ATPase [Victivallales bacterium]